MPLIADENGKLVDLQYLGKRRRKKRGKGRRKSQGQKARKTTLASHSASNYKERTRESYRTVVKRINGVLVPVKIYSALWAEGAGGATSWYRKGQGNLGRGYGPTKETRQRVTANARQERAIAAGRTPHIKPGQMLIDKDGREIKSLLRP